jgi:hypothetical protein
MLTFFYVAGLVLALVLLFAIYLKLDGLPLRVWCLVKRNRYENAGKGFDGKPAGDAFVADLRRLRDEQAELLRIERGLAEIRERKHRERMQELGAIGRAFERVLAALGIFETKAPAVNMASVETTRRPDAPAPISRERPSPRPRVPQAVEPEDIGDDEKTRVQPKPLDATLVSGPGGGAR